jgi:hypothetical protein
MRGGYGSQEQDGHAYGTEPRPVETTGFQMEFSPLEMGTVQMEETFELGIGHHVLELDSQNSTRLSMPVRIVQKALGVHLKLT